MWTLVYTVYTGNRHAGMRSYLFVIHTRIRNHPNIHPSFLLLLDTGSEAS